MPVNPTYPGVYVEEIPSGVRTIVGVATSITAFLGRTARGLANEPVVLNSYGDFTRAFGDLSIDYPVTYAVRDFFVNGGQQAIVVRLVKNAAPAKNADLKLEATSPGAWGNKLTYTVDSKGITDDVAARYGLTKAEMFNLTVYENPGQGRVERILNLTYKSDSKSSRRLDRALAAESSLVEVQLKSNGDPDLVTARPADSLPAEDPSDPSADPTKFKKFTGGTDSDPLTADTDFIGDQNNKTGMYALDKADLFNLLCIPPDTRGGDTPATVYQEAMAYCVDRRAVLLVDPPAAWAAIKETAAASAKAKLGDLGLTGEAARNAALYFPRVVESDPLLDGQLDTFAPSGLVAGLFARTDVQRGVWKAPAGLDAALNGIQGLQANLNDQENGLLNPLGINVLRTFPVTGRVVWGARTLRGADQLADEYKYVPVRRTALYIEESLYRGLKWVVFEPNGDPLWAQIRLNVGAFMNNLFRQGAFQGKTPQEAYFVKCDSETTTQNDINLGIVNIVVGFAPLKPAEFVIIQLQQIAGQIQA